MNHVYYFFSCKVVNLKTMKNNLYLFGRWEELHPLRVYVVRDYVCALDDGTRESPFRIFSTLFIRILKLIKLKNFKVQFKMHQANINIFKTISYSFCPSKCTNKNQEIITNYYRLQTWNKKNIINSSHTNIRIMKRKRPINNLR